MTESVLQEAQRIIHGDRSKSYGHPRDNFQNIADVWSAYKHVEFTPMDVGLMMVLLKVARLENGEYHRDSVTDIAGYAGTLERIFEEPVDLDRPKPRVWEDVTEIPRGVIAEAQNGVGGHSWLRVRNTAVGLETRWDFDARWHFDPATGSITETFGPFTEVVA